MEVSESKRLTTKRARVLKGTLFGIALIIIGATFGFNDSLAWMVTPRTNYYELLFTELARQHFILTGTPVIVKEEDDALSRFQSEYNRRNGRFGFAKETITAPYNSVLQFSFAPWIVGHTGPGVFETPASTLIRENTRPTIWQDEPTVRPLVVWMYSGSELLLAVFVYQLLTPDHPLSLAPPNPDFRMIQDLDWSNVVSTHGPIPEVKVFPEHAFLVSFGDLKVENLDPRATEMPNPFPLVHSLPLVVSRGRNQANAPPVPTAGEVVAILRQQAARPFIWTRRIFRLFVLPVGILLVTGMVWRVSRFRRNFLNGDSGLSFLAFLRADLEAEERAVEVKRRVAQELEKRREREQLEASELKEEIEKCLTEPAFSEDVSRVSEVIRSGSLEDLSQVLEHFRNRMAQEEQQAREREREIHWLMSEFEAVPLLSRQNEAQPAWCVYQQALNEADPKIKLHLLKEARKILPKELRQGKWG